MQWDHVSERIPFQTEVPASRSLECGSHAAAPAVLTIRGEIQRFPPVTGTGRESHFYRIIGNKKRTRASGETRPPTGLCITHNANTALPAYRSGSGGDDGHAPQPGAGSARLRRTWCRYQCWREEPGASSHPWRHSRTARTDDRTQRLPYQEAQDHTSALPSPAPDAMHYPYLVSTTCVSAGMIAIGAVVDDWPDGSAPLQPCYHVLNGLPYTRIRCVSRSLACGSHAAAPAVLSTRRGLQRTPVPVRTPDDGDG